MVDIKGIKNKMKTICYLSCGFPTIERSIDIARLYAMGGCDALELSFPAINPHREGAYIAERMQIAYKACSDYDAYMDATISYSKEYPQVEIFPLLYEEVILKIGAEKIVEFCKKANITTILSADFNDEHARTVVLENGIKIASPVTIKMEEADIKNALRNNGFVYMSAIPRNAEAAKNALPLETRIKKLKDLGINRPFYCGGGIKTPEDVKLIKSAGGDGFFLGSTLMDLYDRTDEMLALLREYKKAADHI